MVQDITRGAEAEVALAEALNSARKTARDAIALVETDQLTGAASSRHTLAFLKRAIDEAHVSGAPLSIAMFDIDHFKAVNDRFGHERGDQVLVQVAEQATGVVRSSDLVGRLGGEDFVVVPPAADALLTMSVADRLRQAVAGSMRSGIQVTISIGVAQLRPGTNARDLLRDADLALYEAKAAGRNTLKLAA